MASSITLDTCTSESIIRQTQGRDCFEDGAPTYALDASDFMCAARYEPGDDVSDSDIILLSGEEKRFITGADLLGYLMRRIARGST